MKILTTIIASLLFAMNCYSQITTITTKEKEAPIEVQKYDSLESLDYENAPLHKGQTLFLKGSSYTKENGFFMTFFSKIVGNMEIKTPHTYKPVSREKDKEIVSNYDELVGKYYKVLSIESKKTDTSNIIYWLKLMGDDNSPFYFRLEKYCGNEFVTLGYYEKMKQTFVGKEFYYKGMYELNKVDTIETIIPPFKTKFKCTDIAVNVGEDGPIFAVLENEKFGRVKGKIIQGKKLENFITITYYNECVKKYGTRFGNCVAAGKIEIGMNKKMVLDAWRAPDHINTTQGSYGTHEQWVYNNGRYLYFENGILTLKQD